MILSAVFGAWIASKNMTPITTIGIARLTALTQTREPTERDFAVTTAHTRNARALKGRGVATITTAKPTDQIPRQVIRPRDAI
jgi:hypothetical protein